MAIDIDGVILDSEKVFRTVADLYNTIKLNDRAIRAYDEPRVQEKYNWTDEEIQEFADKYFIECSKISNFMPCVKEVLNMLKQEGHNLIIITARGRDKKEMRAIAEEKFREDVDIMCNLSQGVKEKGIAIGESIGEERGITIGEASLIKTMYNNGITIEQIANMTNKNIEDIMNMFKIE